MDPIRFVFFGCRKGIQKQKPWAFANRPGIPQRYFSTRFDGENFCGHTKIEAWIRIVKFREILPKCIYSYLYTCCGSIYVYIVCIYWDKLFVCEDDIFIYTYECCWSRTLWCTYQSDFMFIVSWGFLFVDILIIYSIYLYIFPYCHRRIRNRIQIFN